MLKRLLAAAAAVFALAGCGTAVDLTPEPSPEAPTTEAPVPAPRQLAVGECTGPLGSTVSGTTSIQPVDCAEKHSYEVFSLVYLTGDVMPHPDTMRVIANNRCLPAFVDFVGVEPAYSRYASVFVAPDEASWTIPELRRITCLLGSEDGGLTGTARNDTRLFPEVGKCTGPQDVPVLDINVVSCKKEHSYEVYAATVIDAAKAPSAAELAKLVTKVCAGEFRKFVGVEPSASKYEYAYLVADASLWSKIGDHRLVCSVGSPKGEITGSLEGAKA